jgi:hypothetical protein
MVTGVGGPSPTAEQAEEARSRALAAYDRARGTGPSLVPEDR